MDKIYTENRNINKKNKGQLTKYFQQKQAHRHNTG